MVLEEYAARGTKSRIDWRSHQGARQSKLCYPQRIPPFVKESTLSGDSIFDMKTLVKNLDYNKTCTQTGFACPETNPTIAVAYGFMLTL